MSAGRRSRTPARSVVLLVRRERRRGRRYQPRFRLSQIAVTSLGALSAVALMALLSLWSGQPLIVAPLGASCVLLFGYPRSPLAQPRNLVLGNLPDTRCEMGWRRPMRCRQLWQTHGRLPDRASARWMPATWAR